jgi:membrane associated rhomboid family serine protease
VIPLRDLNPTRRRAFVMGAIIIANIAVYLYESSLNQDQLMAFVDELGVIPRNLVQGLHYFPATRQDLFVNPLVTPFTSMFLHGGFLHVLSNMWFLWVFGDNIEDALGHVGFLFFYLICGVAAVAAQVFISPTSEVPMIGASGAISGVLAGYLVLYPRARIVTLLPIFIFIQIVEFPAFVFLFVWFAIQLLSGVMSFGRAEGGVAFFAHVGGFAAGYILLRFGLVRPRRIKRHMQYF